MRKNIFGIVIIMMMALLLSACGNTDSKVDQVIQKENKSEENKPEGTLDDIDVDLTKLSSTMVYSEVYNMMYTPENYIGKTVKMRGMFVVYTNQDQSKIYPAVIIADATACCSQGLEFVLEGNPAYPEAYPEMKTEVSVVGTFETYEEEGNTYCRLQNAKLE